MFFDWLLSPLRIERKLDEVLRLLNALKSTQHRQGRKLMADLSRITDSVAANGSVIGSAVTLIEQIAEALRNASSDQGAIDALAADLEAQAAALAAAVAANTPAA
jgi:putative N-acetylmannosamine-6-phosphate epimerase